MKIKLLLSYLRSFLAWIIVISILCACTPNNTTPITPPEDMPISKFMIGEWNVISSLNTDNGGILEIPFPIVKITSKEISYGETYRAEYNFIQEDIIFVNNLRLTGGETWRLERDNRNLIVYQEYQGFRRTLILERDTR